MLQGFVLRTLSAQNYDILLLNSSLKKVKGVCTLDLLKQR